MLKWQVVKRKVEKTLGECLWTGLFRLYMAGKYLSTTQKPATHLPFIFCWWKFQPLKLQEVIFGLSHSCSLFSSSEPRVLWRKDMAHWHLSGHTLPTSLLERKLPPHPPAVVHSVLSRTPGLGYMSNCLGSLRRWGGGRECAGQILPWAQALPQPATKAGEIASQWPPLATDWDGGGRQQLPKEEGNSP